MKAQLHVGFGSTLFLSKFITIYKLLKMQRQDTCISAFIINVCTCIFEVNLSVLSQRVMAYKEDRDICRPFNLAIGCLQLKTWLYREFSFHPTLCSHIFFSNSIADLKKNRLTPFEAKLLSSSTFVWILKQFSYRSHWNKFFCLKLKVTCKFIPSNSKIGYGTPLCTYIPFLYYCS